MNTVYGYTFHSIILWQVFLPSRYRIIQKWIKYEDWSPYGMWNEKNKNKSTCVEIVSLSLPPIIFKDTDLGAVQDIEQFTIEDSLLRKSIFLNTENLTEVRAS